MHCSTQTLGLAMFLGAFGFFAGGCTAPSGDARGVDVPDVTGNNPGVVVDAVDAGAMTVESAVDGGVAKSDTRPSWINAARGASASGDAAVADALVPTLPSSSSDGAPGAAAQAVLYGGEDGAGLRSDTWVWDGATWTQHDLPEPFPRYDAMMAPLGGKLVMIGGAHGNPAALSDSWAWDGATWTMIAATGPSREHAAMAPLHGALVLFGGMTADPPGPFGDTWTWTPGAASWTELKVAGPSAREGVAMAPLGGALVLFGGWDGTSALSDTWTWNGTAWTALPVSGPSAREGAVMAPFDGGLVLFGGWDGKAALSDTWIWDGQGWTAGPDAGPPARSNAAMTSLNGSLVLFGGGEGLTGPGAKLYGDTWTFTASGWTKIEVVGPSPRTGSVMSTL